MKDDFLKKNAHQYIYIYSDCQLAKGFLRSSVCDISRKRVFFIANAYYDLTKYFRNKTIGEIADLLVDDASLLQFYKFVNFLIDEHIATLVDDIDSFPEINVYWDHPSTIINAIIDIRHKFQYLSKSIQELSDLQCNYLQIRIFELIDSETIQYISFLVKEKCFKDIEILVKYCNNETWQDTLKEISRRQKNIRFVVHSFPHSLVKGMDTSIKYTTQIINAVSHCGVINLYTLHVPSIQGFMENKLYNSCLNRKISVDENGYIKNCPSMEKHYGHIAETSLVEVIKKEDFQYWGSINKDQISTCKDCEFRYMCSDCRAYTVGGKLNAKPLKCKYNPYKALWEG